MSGCIYTDVNESRQNLYLKLISAIHNLSNDHAAADHDDDPPPVITYNLHGDWIPLNDWDNPDFFPIAFPALFPYEDGGHIAPRSIKVSLHAWAKWALSHHSRRFARHPVFMYVVYDVMQRRSALLGYSLLVKSKQWTETQSLISNISYDELCEAADAVRSTNTCTHPGILALERQVQLVAAHVPHSYAKCFQYRLQLRALMVTKGMPPFWITVNPSDLRCPIVLWLAGVAVSFSESTTSAFRYATATMNPVAVATFFHETCRGIFNQLLKAGSSEGGLFGPVSTYFGTVETNGRGMLHLNCLV